MTSEGSSAPQGKSDLRVAPRSIARARFSSAKIFEFAAGERYKKRGPAIFSCRRGNRFYTASTATCFCGRECESLMTRISGT